ncbi:MAG TPA: molybdopterin converting factor subunit 1 [Thermoanaerobaculia bacterium]|jgi:molybdopterin converting factor subunit 1|nr:molybdopterin converting factor subunit 1 [Thermoanaerobaculia bacterium]
MLRIKLLFFAVLRDVAGRSEEVIELPDGARAGDVWQRLRDEHPVLREYIQPPMIAVNESYAGADEPLRDGDELAFIPPVAGG